MSAKTQDAHDQKPGHLAVLYITCYTLHGGFHETSASTNHVGVYMHKALCAKLLKLAAIAHALLHAMYDPYKMPNI